MINGNPLLQLVYVQLLSLVLCNVVTIFNNPKMRINSVYLHPGRFHKIQAEENMKREKQKFGGKEK